MSNSVIDTNSVNLPDDFILNILSRLPVKSLVRFRCVCKSWRSIISDPYFVKLHLNRSIENHSNLSLILRGSYLYSVDFDTFDNAVEVDHPLKSPHFGTEVLGSCNGLLCIYNAVECISLWNPSTRKCQKLPITPIEFPSGFTFCTKIVYGFGYDPITNDYKVIRIACFLSNDDGLNESEVKVYTLSTNSWRRVQDIPFNLLCKRNHGILANNALHWVTTCQVESDNLNLVFSFDLRDESYKEVPLPDFGKHNFCMNVEELGGCLSLICNFDRNCVEIWVMKEYRVRESWIKMYSIGPPGVISSFGWLRPLCYLKNGEVLLEQDNEKLVRFNPESEKSRNVRIRGIPDWFETMICVGSLVPLNDDYEGQVDDDDDDDDDDDENYYDSEDEFGYIMYDYMFGYGFYDDDDDDDDDDDGGGDGEINDVDADADQDGTSAGSFL